MTQAINEPAYFALINREELKFFSVSATPVTDRNIKNIMISEQAALQFLSGKEPIDKWNVTYDAATDEYDIIRDTSDSFNYLRIQLQEQIKIPTVASDVELDIRFKLNTDNNTVEIHFKNFIITTYPEIRFAFTKDDDPRYYKGLYSLNKIGVDALIAKNESVNPIILSVEDVSDLSIYTKLRNLKIAIQ
jgi:hypothetical protein